MKKDGSAEVIKHINLGNKQKIYLKIYGDEVNVIEVINGYNSRNEEYFLWNTLINIECIDLKKLEVSQEGRYFYKGCVISFESERDEMNLTACIEGDIDVKNKYIGAGYADSGNDIVSKNIKEALVNIRVPGRSELVDNKLGLTIMIDYAHTPDAMEKLIHTVKSVCDGNIYAVFGCTGSREREKRPVMMKLATTLCKYVIVTIDDLHEEEAQDIVADMLKDNHNENYEVELDRRKAIAKGIQKLNHHDILLIMGKGHEDVIIVKDKTIPFNDVEVVREILEEKKALS